MKTTRHKLRVKSRKKLSARSSGLSTFLQDELLRFMEYHPVGRLKRNLRKMLLEFLMHDGALESFYLKDLLYDLEGFFELLDALEEESRIEDNQG